MAQTKKPRVAKKAASAKKTAEKTTASKKPIAKKTPAGKEPLAKKATPKKSSAKAKPSQKPASSKVGHGAFEETSVSFPFPLPKDVDRLFSAYCGEGGILGPKFQQAVKDLSPQSAKEILQCLDWDSEGDEPSLAHMLKTPKVTAKALEELRLGIYEGSVNARDLLAETIFHPSPTVNAARLETIDRRMCRLFECCCCSHRWPCRPYPFCRLCYKHRCLIEVRKTSPAVYDHVHRLSFSGPVKTSVTGVSASTEIDAYSKAEANSLLSNHASNASNKHTFGSVANTFAEGNHSHAGAYEPVIAKKTAFNQNFGAGATDVAKGDHVHTGVYEPVITQKTAFNQNFGTGASDVARGDHAHTFGTAAGEYAQGDHNHESFGTSPNYTPAYARKFFFDQVANPALSPNGGTGGTNPGEAEICIADNAAAIDRLLALQAGGVTPKVVIKGYSFQTTSTAFELIITQSIPVLIQNGANFYLRFKISDGANNYRPGASPWITRFCLITYCVYE